MNETILDTNYSANQSLADVLKERVRQDTKWGEQNHHPFAWLAILMEEVGEWSQEAVEGHFGGWTPERAEKMRTEAVQVAAVALSIVECIDRNPMGT